MPDKLVRILTHFEEVCLFLCSLYLASTVWALAVNCLCFCKEGFAGSAVPALVFALIYVALIIEFFKHLLNSALVIIVGCTDKVVIGRVHLVPNTLDLACNTVNV